MPETEATPDIAALTVQLLSAYLSNNTVSADELAGLIRSTRIALVEDAAPAQAEAEAPTYTPAVSARKSLSSPDHILSLIDGKPYKTLKRHLASNGLTPEQYRERYSLPATYPMVAPAFAARRREIAEKIGLGFKRNPASSAVDADVSKAASPATAPVRPEPVVSDAPAAVAPKSKSATTRKANKTRTKNANPTAASSVTPVLTDPAQQSIAAPNEAVMEKPKTAKPASTRKALKAAPADKKEIPSKAKVAEPAKPGAAPVVPTEGAKPSARRLGKLGLFTDGDAAAGGTADTSSSTLVAKETGKAPRAKRIARKPNEAARAPKPK
jgi:predicted transcriptional regulator